jgi:CRISPR system Cascade subunit CasE
MSWLARLDVDAETARVESISDNYVWHKKIWQCYPNAPEVKRDFLTRIDQLEGAFRLWVLSKRKPVRPEWCAPESYAIKEIAPSFLSHRYYAFDLRVNPVKTIVQRGPNGETLMQPNGKRKNGKRIPLVNSKELYEWIIRKSIAGGFRVVDDKTLEISPMMENHFRKKDRKSGKEQSAYHGGVQYRGTLEVTDPEKFMETYHSGIGSAKGFGFGLLLLAPLNL